MTRATRCAEYTGPAAPCLYLAFELGNVEWKLAFTTEPGATPRVRTIPARDLERLTREIADAKKWFGMKAATPVRSCYEAGRDGFWLHRYLTSIAIAERSRGLIEHRSESTAPASEVGCPGCPQAARDAAAVPRRGAEGLECGARAHGGRKIGASCTAGSGP